MKKEIRKKQENEKQIRKRRRLEKHKRRAVPKLPKMAVFGCKKMGLGMPKSKNGEHFLSPTVHFYFSNFWVFHSALLITLTTSCSSHLLEATIGAAPQISLSQNAPFQQDPPINILSTGPATVRRNIACSASLSYSYCQRCHFQCHYDSGHFSGRVQNTSQH